MLDTKRDCLRKVEEIKGYVRRRESFALETTLSGRLYAGNVQQWQEAIAFNPS